MTHEELYVGKYNIQGIDGLRTWEVFATVDSAFNVRSITLRYGTCVEIDVLSSEDIHNAHKLVLRGMAETRALACIPQEQKRLSPLDRARATWGIPSDFQVVI